MTGKGQLLRADGVAAIIGVTTKKAAELMRQMPRVNIGASLQSPRWAVYEADVQTWITSRQVPADVPGQPKRTPRRHSGNISQLNGLLDANGHIARRK